MEEKLRKTIREIERTKEKISELQALLPNLERRKTELENARIIKAFRSADVSPDDFAAFIEACRKGRRPPAKNEPAAPVREEDTEEKNDEE